MGKIREISTEKAKELQSALRSQAQIKFIHQVMEWEGVDYEMALAICEGRTKEKEWEYTLGFKMADPLMQMALNLQPGKKARAQAAENFKRTLTPEEREIFEREVETMNTRSMMKSALKRKKA